MKKRLTILFLIFLIGICHGHAAATEKYSYERMRGHLQQLAKTYGLEMKVIGHSEFEREILAIKVGKGPRSVLVTGSHHGREWLTTHLIMKMIDQYAIAYQKGISLYGHNLNVLDEISIWFVPMVNPDGVMIQQKGIAEFPFLLQEVYLDMNKGDQDFSRWKANGLGVDLNRQYPAGWEKIEGDQPHASYSHYKGKKPFEASEVKALLAFTKNTQPLVSASYHTSGRMIYWYYFNELQYLQRDYQLIEQVAEKTDYEISYPPANAIGGGYTDWFIQEYKRPALTLELSYLVEETNPPLCVLEEEWEKNKEVGLILANFAKREFLQ
jgi:g-D-glutamyl-meso-diaminopimelate peptidase